jgi:hypothetical protein
MTSMNTSEASKEESDKGGEEEPYEEYEVEIMDSNL